MKSLLRGDFPSNSRIYPLVCGQVLTQNSMWVGQNEDPQDNVISYRDVSGLRIALLGAEECIPLAAVLLIVEYRYG